MQKRVVLVSAAVAVLGLAAAVLGFVAESTKSKAFVRFDGQRCVYKRTPAHACGVAAALLALTGLALATVDSKCLRCDAPATGRRRAVAVMLSVIAWVVVAVAVVMFLYGAAMNRGGTRGLSPSRRGGWHHGRGAYYYGCAVHKSWTRGHSSRRRYGRAYHYHYSCTVLKNGFFATASVLSAAATGCAVAAYVYFQRTDDEPAPGQFVAQGVAMEQPQWAQPYPPPSNPPPPMACPAPPPQ